MKQLFFMFSNTNYIVKSLNINFSTYYTVLWVPVKQNSNLKFVGKCKQNIIIRIAGIIVYLKSGM